MMNGTSEAARDITRATIVHLDDGSGDQLGLSAGDHRGHRDAAGPHPGPDDRPGDRHRMRRRVRRRPEPEISRRRRRLQRRRRLHPGPRDRRLLAGHAARQRVRHPHVRVHQSDADPMNKETRAMRRPDTVAPRRTRPDPDPVRAGDLRHRRRGRDRPRRRRGLRPAARRAGRRRPRRDGRRDGVPELPGRLRHQERRRRGGGPLDRHPERLHPRRRRRRRRRRRSANSSTATNVRVDLTGQHQQQLRRAPRHADLGRVRDGDGPGRATRRTARSA